MFSKWVVCVLTFFTINGYHSELWPTSTHRKMAPVIFLMHFILGILMTYYLFEFMLWMNVNLKKLNMINEVIEYSIAVMTYWAIIIESYVKRKTQRKFWEYVRAIDQNYAQHNAIILQSYLYKFFEYSTFYFSALTFFMIKVNNFSNISAPILIARWLLLETCSIRLTYYLFYLELMQFELKVIEKEVLEMSKSNIYRVRNSQIKQFERHRLMWLRKYYKVVHELVSCVNSVFGWSSPLTFLANFNFLLTDLNWGYYHRLKIDISTVGMLSFSLIFSRSIFLFNF